ncbi:DNA-binding response regulator [Fulvitalea axinellae]|uniref:DNA-binding response regulator n=1 Tax=Fulvitalea axinellae TaxID=1182444 RepID=A0AAU9CJU4_9BACT|nr:DNA-binding response regulator [Fulvitalea axinellae]
MEKVKTLIVDDEHLARTLLRDYVEKIPELELAGICKNGLEAMEFIRNNKVDLVFLDIQMPNLTGVEMLDALSYQTKTFTERPFVVFTTAYSEYALKGYELDVFDYLLKPITFPRFLKCASKVIEIKNTMSKVPNQPAEQAVQPSFVHTHQDYISIKADHKLFKVKLNDIVFIEGQREYVTFHTLKRKIMALASLKKLESDLPSGQFIRIHKSYIVSKDYIETMDGNMLEVGEHRLPVGQSYRSNVLQIFE